MESGAPVTGIYWPATSAYSEAHYALVVSKAGCSKASNKLACLRSLDFDSLYGALKPTNDFTLPFYLPSIDGNFIAESPSKQLDKGRYVKIPTIQGQNNDEGALFTVSVRSNSDAQTRDWFLSFFPTKRRLMFRNLSILFAFCARHHPCSILGPSS